MCRIEKFADEVMEQSDKYIRDHLPLRNGSVRIIGTEFSKDNIIAVEVIGGKVRRTAGGREEVFQLLSSG